MASGGKRTIELGLRARDLTAAAFTKVQAGFRRLRAVARRTMASISKITMGARSQLLLLLGAMGGFRAFVTAPAEFNKQLQFTGTLGAEARARLGEFGEEVKRLGVETGIPLVQINRALFDIISAGTKAGDAIGVLREASRLAVGGMADLRSTVRGLATVTNAYGLSGKKAFREIANELFAAQVIGKTTIEDLSENVGKLASTASEANIPIRELFTAFADTANVMNNTEQASVSVRQAIMGILKPNEDLKEILLELNIPLGEAAFKGRTLGELFSSIRGKAKELEKPFAAVIGNVRAIAAASVLAQRDGKRFEEMMERQGKLAGELSIAYENMRKELLTTLERLKNLGTVLAQDFSAGATIGLSGALDELLDKMVELRLRAKLAGLEFRLIFEELRPHLSNFMDHILSFIDLIKMGVATLSVGAQKIVTTIIHDFTLDPVEDLNNRLRENLDETKKLQDELNRASLLQAGVAADIRFEQIARRTGVVAGKQLEDLQDRTKRGLAELEKIDVEHIERQLAAWTKLKTHILKDREAVMKAGADVALGRPGEEGFLFSGGPGPTWEQVEQARDTGKEFAEIINEARDRVLKRLGSSVDLLGDNELLANLRKEIDLIESELEGLAAVSKAVLSEFHHPMLPPGWSEMLKFAQDEMELMQAVLDAQAAMGKFPGLPDFLLPDKDLVTNAEKTKEFWKEFFNSWDKGVREAQLSLSTWSIKVQEFGKGVIDGLTSSVSLLISGWIDGTKTAKEVLQGFLVSVGKMIADLMAQQAVLQFLNLMGIGKPVTPRVGVHSPDYLDELAETAHGGVFSGPQVRIIGEAGPEAVVPLPNGRAIPVDFRGGGGGGGGAVTINISAVDGPSVHRMLMSDDGRRAIQSAVRDARATRRDFR